MASQSRDTSVNKNGTVQTHAVNRRKIRKGTFSCWECKRRKTRCQFQPLSSSVCVSCRRHDVPCVSQESEEPGGIGCERNEKRLADMERLVEQLIQQRTLRWRMGTPVELPDEAIEAEQVELLEDRAIEPPSTVRRSTKRKITRTRSPFGLLRVTEDAPSRCSSLCNYLQSMFPNSTIVGLITSHGRSPLAVLEHPAKMAGLCTAAAQQLSPIAGAVALARDLIQLALCLERFDFNAAKLPNLHLGAPNGTIARRFVDAACHVTCQDFIMSSLEGVELLMLQSSFETAVGNLQSAWLTIRRAVNIAQLMNCSQRVHQTQGRQKLTWLRLVQFDYALSLMLGQRSSVNCCNLTSDHETSSEPPTMRLKSIHAAISDRIISRNLRMQERIQRGVSDSDAHDDYKETQNIDQELKEAMRSLPVGSWNQKTMPSTEADAANLLAQIHHYDLLVLVHLPYLIHGPHSQCFNSINNKHEYNKFAALSASREVLSRALLCGNNRDVPCSLSGLNHKAFTASITLLLAHINGHSLGRENVLEHQRPLDLKMIHEVIDLMAYIARVSTATLSSWDSTVLGKLLDIEEEAANGRTCIARTGTASFAQERNGCFYDNVNLQFSLPYLGMITIECFQREVAEPLYSISESTCSYDYLFGQHATIESSMDSVTNGESTFTSEQDQSNGLWPLSSLVEPDDFLVDTL